MDPLRVQLLIILFSDTHVSIRLLTEPYVCSNIYLLFNRRRIAAKESCCYSTNTGLGLSQHLLSP